MARLETAGYEFVSTLGIPGHVLRSPDDVEIDVLLSEACAGHLGRQPQRLHVDLAFAAHP